MGWGVLGSHTLTRITKCIPLPEILACEDCASLTEGTFKVPGCLVLFHTSHLGLLVSVLCTAASPRVPSMTEALVPSALLSAGGQQFLAEPFPKICLWLRRATFPEFLLFPRPALGQGRKALPGCSASPSAQSCWLPFHSLARIQILRALP